MRTPINHVGESVCSPKATGRGQLWGWEQWRHLSGKRERLIQTSSCGFSSNSPGRGHQAGQRRTNDSGWQEGPSGVPPFTFQHPSLHRSRKSHHRLPPRDRGEDPGLHLQAHRSRRTANGKTLKAYSWSRHIFPSNPSEVSQGSQSKHQTLYLPMHWDL